MESGLPVGIRFRPTDYELVGHFLHNKAVMGDQFQTNCISDCPGFYGQNEPWVIWDLYSGGKVEDDEPLYFFTHRNKLSPSAEFFDQKVGSGTWMEQEEEDVVDRDDNYIGICRHFQYEGGCDPHQNGAWLMQEYQSLTTYHNNDATDQELVLCTLRKNPEKLPPGPPARTTPTFTQVMDSEAKRET